MSAEEKMCPSPHTYKFKITAATAHVSCYTSLHISPQIPSVIPKPLGNHSVLPVRRQSQSSAMVTHVTNEEERLHLTFTYIKQILQNLIRSWRKPRAAE